MHATTAFCVGKKHRAHIARSCVTQYAPPLPPGACSIVQFMGLVAMPPVLITGALSPCSCYALHSAANVWCYNSIMERVLLSCQLCAVRLSSLCRVLQPWQPV